MAIRGDRPSAVVVRCPSVAVALRYRRRQLATGGRRRCPAVARREKNVKEPVLLHDSPAANTIDLVNVSVLIFAAGESCNSTGYIAPAVARTPLNAGRQLPAANRRYLNATPTDGHRTTMKEGLTPPIATVVQVPPP